jgi:hypothetical protein
MQHEARVGGRTRREQGTDSTYMARYGTPCKITCGMRHSRSENLNKAHEATLQTLVPTTTGFVWTEWTESRTECGNLNEPGSPVRPTEGDESRVFSTTCPKRTGLLGVSESEKEASACPNSTLLNALARRTVALRPRPVTAGSRGPMAGGVRRLPALEDQWHGGSDGVPRMAAAGKPRGKWGIQK